MCVFSAKDVFLLTRADHLYFHIKALDILVAYSGCLFPLLFKTKQNKKQNKKKKPCDVSTLFEIIKCRDF